MKPSTRFTIRIGTRASVLAKWQANWVAQELSRLFPEARCQLVTIRTKGDKILNSPLSSLGGKGLFVKEIEEALLQGKVDLAVHSMKDLPADLAPGLTLAAVPPRENPSDVLISSDEKTLEELPEGSIVGTSSLRRKAQVLERRPDLRVVELRGNVDTRLAKLDRSEGGLKAIVLAAAGIKRMGLWSRVTQVLDPTDFLPAIGQGALAIEVRSKDERMRELLAPLDHLETRACVTAERAIMRELQGGCQVPMAALGLAEQDGGILLSAMVAGLEGRPVLKYSLKAALGEPHRAGLEVAHALLRMGAAEILERLRKHQPGS
ncbi:MAG: hydroxymethylbilane synthase [bacterium]